MLQTLINTSISSTKLEIQLKQCALVNLLIFGRRDLHLAYLLHSVVGIYIDVCLMGIKSM
jgi:hypothetical protein